MRPRLGRRQCSATRRRPSAGGNLAINSAYLWASGRLRSSCGGTMLKVAAVSAVYPVLDPAGLCDNRDPALGGTSRDMAGAYTGGPPSLIVIGEQAYRQVTAGWLRGAPREDFAKRRKDALVRGRARRLLRPDDIGQ